LQNITAQRLYRKHKKHDEDHDNDGIKLTENTDIFGRRWLYIEGRQVTGGNTG